MDDSQWKEIYEKLRKPFPIEVISWKPGPSSGDSAMAQTYAAPRAYVERLNQVVGGNWSDRYITRISENPHDPIDRRMFVTCTLTIHGVSRSDVGEEPLMQKTKKGIIVPAKNAYTTCIAQAFKRACVRFELGLYLYNWDFGWKSTEYNRFTKQAITSLEAAYRSRLAAEGFTVSEDARSEAVLPEREELDDDGPAWDKGELDKAAGRKVKGKGGEFRALGDLTSPMLDLVIHNTNSDQIKAQAKLLTRFLGEHFGADVEITYNKSKQNRK